MALISCKECNEQVSDQALKCPKCGFQLRKPKRGFFGKLAKWSLIGFNLLMMVWLLSYLGDVGKLSAAQTSEAGKAGAAIGTALGTGMLLGFWVVGDIILGLWAMLTRPR